MIFYWFTLLSLLHLLIFITFITLLLLPLPHYFRHFLFIFITSWCHFFLMPTYLLPLYYWLLSLFFIRWLFSLRQPPRLFHLFTHISRWYASWLRRHFTLPLLLPLSKLIAIFAIIFHYHWLFLQILRYHIISCCHWYFHCWYFINTPLIIFWLLLILYYYYWFLRLAILSFLMFFIDYFIILILIFWYFHAAYYDIISTYEDYFHYYTPLRHADYYFLFTLSAYFSQPERHLYLAELRHFYLLIYHWFSPSFHFCWYFVISLLLHFYVFDWCHFSFFALYHWYAYFAASYIFLFLCRQTYDALIRHYATLFLYAFRYISDITLCPDIIATLDANIDDIYAYAYLLITITYYAITCLRISHLRHADAFITPPASRAKPLHLFLLSLPLLIFIIFFSLLFIFFFSFHDISLISWLFSLLIYYHYLMPLMMPLNICFHMTAAAPLILPLADSWHLLFAIDFIDLLSHHHHHLPPPPPIISPPSPPSLLDAFPTPLTEYHVLPPLSTDLHITDYHLKILLRFDCWCCLYLLTLW